MALHMAAPTGLLTHALDALGDWWAHTETTRQTARAWLLARLPHILRVLTIAAGLIAAGVLLADDLPWLAPWVPLVGLTGLTTVICLRLADDTTETIRKDPEE